MTRESGLNPGDEAMRLSDAEMSRRREEIFRSMVVVADRRRRGRRVKRVAAGALFTAAAIAVAAGVLGTFPPSAPASHGGSGGELAATKGAGGTGEKGPVQPVGPQPAQLVRSVTVQVIGPVTIQEVTGAAGGGVERLEASTLRRVVVAERLTDEAFELELATQADVGTARVRGRVLVLNNNPVAEESPEPPRVH